MPVLSAADHLQRLRCLLAVVCVLGGAFVAEVRAQSTMADDSLAAERVEAERESRWAWRPLFTHGGVEFTYIYYDPDGRRQLSGAVVMKLRNTNAYSVAYAFKIVMRAGERIVVEPVEGVLRPGEAKTGDKAGLYWIPFERGVDIGEIGLRGYAVERLGRDEAPQMDGARRP